MYKRVPTQIIKCRSYLQTRTRTAPVPSDVVRIAYRCTDRRTARREPCSGTWNGYKRAASRVITIPYRSRYRRHDARAEHAVGRNDSDNGER